jgi:hypothetical protein
MDTTKVYFIDEFKWTAFSEDEAVAALKSKINSGKYSYIKTVNPKDVVQLFYTKDEKTFSFPILVSSLL